MAAAPADFRPERSAEKLKRADGLDLHLEPTEDILAGLASRRGENQTIVGFAAEHGGDPVTRAREKLHRKGADLIVLNDVSDPAIGFESPDNAATLVSPDGEATLPFASKEQIATQILDYVDVLRRDRGSPQETDTQSGPQARESKEGTPGPSD